MDACARLSQSTKSEREVHANIVLHAARLPRRAHGKTRMSDLKDPSEEPLREEEAGEPEARRRSRLDLHAVQEHIGRSRGPPALAAVADPFLENGDALNEIRHPRTQRLQRRVCYGNKQSRTQSNDVGILTVTRACVPEATMNEYKGWAIAGTLPFDSTSMPLRTISGRRFKGGTSQSNGEVWTKGTTSSNTTFTFLPSRARQGRPESAHFCGTRPSRKAPCMASRDALMTTKPAQICMGAGVRGARVS